MIRVRFDAYIVFQYNLQLFCIHKSNMFREIIADAKENNEIII